MRASSSCSDAPAAPASAKPPARIEATFTPRLPQAASAVDRVLAVQQDVGVVDVARDRVDVLVGLVAEDLGAARIDRQDLAREAVLRRKRCGRDVVFAYRRPRRRSGRCVWARTGSRRGSWRRVYSATMLTRRRFHRRIRCCLALPRLRALADTWPSKPIKLVVPYAPGGTTDVVGRMIGRVSRPAARPEHRRRQQARQGRDHRHGAGRQGPARRLHAADVERSPACRSRPRSMATSTSIRCADFVHITIASRNPSVLVVNPALPGQDLRRVCRLCEGQSRQARLRDLGRRARATTSSARDWAR